MACDHMSNRQWGLVASVVAKAVYPETEALPPWFKGATSLVTSGALPSQNFDCGGDRPREVGAYANQYNVL